MLIRGLPADAILWAVMHDAEQKELKSLTSVERIRERQAHYKKRAEEAQ